MNRARTALFPGSFDPPSLGHLDIIRRASHVCDRLVVAVGYNREKHTIFNTEERVALMQEATHDLDYVEVLSFEGLLIDFAQEIQADFLLRGLRAFSDFEYEFRMGLANRRLSGIETMFLMTSPRFAHVSSTLAREIGKAGGELAEFVPEPILANVSARLATK